MTETESPAVTLKELEATCVKHYLESSIGDKDTDIVRAINDTDLSVRAIRHSRVSKEDLKKTYKAEREAHLETIHIMKKYVKYESYFGPKSSFQDMILDVIRIELDYLRLKKSDIPSWLRELEECFTDMKGIELVRVLIDSNKEAREFLKELVCA